MKINDLAKRIHELNAKWWVHLETGEPIKRNRGELLMLVITELSEAVEGIRKSLMDDKLPHRKMEEVEMADAYIRLLDFACGFNIPISDNRCFGAELVYLENKAEAILIISKSVAFIHDAVSTGEVVALTYRTSQALGYIESYCKVNHLDLEGAIEEKLEFNKTRVDHTHEARALANGKKF